MVIVWKDVIICHLPQLSKRRLQWHHLQHLTEIFNQTLGHNIGLPLPLSKLFHCQKDYATNGKNLRECGKLWCKVAEWSRNQQLSQLWGLCLGTFKKSIENYFGKKQKGNPASQLLLLAYHLPSRPLLLPNSTIAATTTATYTGLTPSKLTIYICSPLPISDTNLPFFVQILFFLLPFPSHKLPKNRKL